MKDFLPDCVVRSRKLSCAGCSCDVDSSSPCSQCPRMVWGPVLCEKPPINGSYQLVSTKTIKREKENNALPSLTTMAKTATQSASNWIQSGIPISSKELLEERQAICKACEFWNQKAFGGTGRCMKCGCSTWAKLRMATEKCPIGKW